MKIVFDTNELLVKRQELEARIAELQQEMRDLDTAMRVFESLNREDKPSNEAVETTAADDNKLGPARPHGIPTLFQMTYEVIREAEQQGKPGLTGAAIVEEIGKRYWPGVKGQQILPSVYGFAKFERLEKTDDGLFHTVRKNEALSEDSESAPQVTGEPDRSPIETKNQSTDSW